MLLVLAAILTTPAHACGGFFCNNVDPVVQSGERILFHVADGRVTTYVEVQYDGQPDEFAWVVPVPQGMDIDADVGTAAPGLFDELEELTAPRFEVESASAALDARSSYGGSAGCGVGYSQGTWDSGWWQPDMSGVEVVGEAVVGPYAIELISAESSDNLLNWLQFNGYQIPFSALDLVDHYVEADLDFIGVKLQPELPEGPVDTLSFSFDADLPTVPLLLTSVAAVENMEITAYVLADQRYAPANYTDLDFPWGEVRWTDPEAGETDYEVRLASAVDDAGGKAWNTEFAARTAGLVTSGMLSPDLTEIIERDAYLTRFHTFISPAEMTRDPSWIPAPQQGDVHPIHTLAPSVPEGRRSPAGGAAWLLLPLLGLGLRRKR